MRPFLPIESLFDRFGGLYADDRTRATRNGCVLYACASRFLIGVVVYLYGLRGLRTLSEDRTRATPPLARPTPALLQARGVLEHGALFDDALCVTRVDGDAHAAACGRQATA